MNQSTSFAQVATNQFDYLSSASCANTPPCKKHSSSRKFLTLSISLRLLLVMLLTLTVSAEVWSADITFTGDDIRSSFNFGTNYGEATFISDGFSIYSSSGYGNTSGQFRVAKNAKLTISSSVGNITKVVIEVTSTTYKLNDTNNKISWSSTTGTYTASASGSTSVTFNNNSNSIARIKSIQIFYSSSTSYTVTYHANGATSGSVPTDVTKYTKGATVTVKHNSGTLAKTGYTFGGWNTKADGTGINYTAGSGTFTIADNTTLYAKWTVNTHTLTWNVNGGNDLTGTYTQGTVAYGATITKPSNPTRTGHTFKGWSIDGTNIVTPASTMPDNDLTYIALWTPLTQYTVKWMVNGIKYTEGNPTASVYEGAKWSSLTLPTAPNPNDYCGQVFAGWTTTNIGSTGLDKDNDATAIQNLNLMTSENKSSKTNTITGDITFYAVFADYAD